MGKMAVERTVTRNDQGLFRDVVPELMMSFKGKFQSISTPCSGFLNAVGVFLKRGLSLALGSLAAMRA